MANIRHVYDVELEKYYEEEAQKLDPEIIDMIWRTSLNLDEEKDIFTIYDPDYYRFYIRVVDGIADFIHDNGLKRMFRARAKTVLPLLLKQGDVVLAFSRLISVRRLALIRRLKNMKQETEKQIQELTKKMKRSKNKSYYAELINMLKKDIETIERTIIFLEEI